MNEEIKRVSEIAKKLVAAGLFLFLLTGGAATVLSVLAAGLNTLSSKPSAPVQLAASAQNGNSQSQVTANSANGNWSGTGSTNTAAGSSGSKTGSAGSSPTSQPAAAVSAQSQAVTMTSPVGEALDKGGVVVGEHVQQAFGNVLSNMIRILFVERPETYSTSSSGQGTSSQTQQTQQPSSAASNP